MTQEEITKAFEGRWRIKSANRPEAWVKGVKDLCFDFFQAALLLSEGSDTNTTPAAVHAASAAGSSESFDTWWNLYQKKRGKEKCMKKWAKLSTKDKQACIAATPAYVASTPDVIYRKDPYTYLNNRSWNDEIYFRNDTDKPSLDEQRLSKLADIIAG